MKEADVRHWLKDHLKPYGHIEAVENSVASGPPDTNGCIDGQEFWIEIKYREEWPKRDTTFPLKDVLRPAQRIWFMKRIEAGAKNTFIFARIDSDLLLWPGSLWSSIEQMTTDQLTMSSIWWQKLRKIRAPEIDLLVYQLRDT